MAVAFYQRETAAEEVVEEDHFEYVRVTIWNYFGNAADQLIIFD